MAIRYGNKVDPLVARKSNFYRKDRFDTNIIKKPATNGTDSTWTRPSEWWDMPSFAPNEQKIAMLVPVYSNGSNYLSFTIAGAYTVDWGDGSAPENFASGTRCQKEYDFFTGDYYPLPDPEPSSTVRWNGAKLAIVVVTPQAGQDITSANFNQKFAASGLGTVPDTSPIIELVISAPNMTSLSLGNNNALLAFCKNLISFRGVNLNGLTSGANLFSRLPSLANVSIDTIGTLTSTANMFFFCNSLTNVSLFNTASVTNMNTMFSNCTSLVNIPLFNTFSVTNMQGMFQGCVTLVTIPLFDTRNVTNMNSMFSSCESIISIPLLNTSSVSNMNAMFGLCRNLKSVPLFDTSSVTIMSSMFSGCFTLKEIPLFNTSQVVSMNYMFDSCASLQSIPLFNTQNVLSMNFMFSSCRKIQSIPLFNTTVLNDTDQMFNGCSSLTSVPLFNTSSVTSMARMFAFCTALKTVPLFDTSSVLNMNQMFSGCRSLISVPLFNTASVTNMNTMFSNCSSLIGVPTFNTSSVTNMANMFVNCFSLLDAPTDFDTVSVTDMTNMFNGCNSLVEVVDPTFAAARSGNLPFFPPLFNTSSVTNMTGMFSGCSSLKTVGLTINVGAGTTTTKFSNIFASCPNLSLVSLKLAEYSLSLASCNMSKVTLEEAMDDLDTIGAAGQILTISNNPASPTPISINTPSDVVAGAGSTTIQLQNVTGLETGMQFTGTGSPLTTGRGVTFTDVGDIVTLASHGLEDGDAVSFSSITTTTGIVINKRYTVLNKTSNTFQLDADGSLTPVNLISNGSGTIRYASLITGIIGNSVTVSRPTASIPVNTTLSFRQLATSIAIHKGWSVTG
jgi:surface protein